MLVDRSICAWRTLCGRQMTRNAGPCGCSVRSYWAMADHASDHIFTVRLRGSLAGKAGALPAWGLAYHW